MNDAVFGEELENTLYFATKYASDFYGLKKYEDTLRISKEGLEIEFIYKCHEGYKKAQSSIIKNILLIEEDIKEAKKELAEYEKGRGKKYLEKDYKDKILKKKVDNLIVQKSSFQEVANVIVWSLFKMQRTDIKSCIQKDGGSGYLKDKDIEGVLKIADKINKKEDEFALITDITSCIHIGDLIIVRNGGIKIVEVKQKSDINDLVQDVACEFIKKGEMDKEKVEKICQKSNKYGLRQIKRSCKQLLKASSVISYIKTGSGYDWNYDRQKKVTRLLTPDSNNILVLVKFLEKFYKSNKKMDFINLDCLVVGVFKKNDNSEFDIEISLEFKHHIYHILKKSWGECQYGNLKEEDFLDKNFKLELVEYSKYEIYNLKSLVCIPTHVPLFLLLPAKYSMDLITDKIAIYIYFDVNKFLGKCKKNKIPMILCDKRRIQKMLDGIGENFTILFNDKHLCISSGGSEEIKTVIGNGLLFKLIFEFQTSESFLKQVKEQIKLDNPDKI
ncbi:MAG: hypothetical protein M0Q94_14075 [Candidatus Cloacimonetes bacterium]|nr:hypothetical protein [Candidatus Cloacimonadota bacterium]